jgi:hypothetical protein
MSHPFAVDAGGTIQPVNPDSTLDAAGIEDADAAANRWIKQLRHARVDGVSLRDRFTHRGDSLWWFAELYLHKMQVVSRAHRAIAALEHLAAARPGARWVVDGSDHVVGHVAHLVARRHGLGCDGPADRRRRTRRAAVAAKAVFHTASACADRLRPRTAPVSASVTVAAFVHSAFVGGGAADEAYVGPVLRELEARLPEGALRLVGLGPRTNFRVRRWRDRAAEFVTPHASGSAVPVTAFATWRMLEPSRRVWRDRASVYEACAGSEDLHAASVIGGYDVWPLVLEELRGIADLQLPWSARAMDEAGAALDALSPQVVITYAEAGGWGRALMLEARRRGIPTVALQHGFIYRHWLNYQHEADEMQPSPANSGDRGFPRPDCTLVFDELTREHLTTHGRFPAGSVKVTGSARLDAIVAAARAMDQPARARLRATLGAGTETPIALVAAKHAQLGDAFPALVSAARSMPEMRLVVKPHPAEAASPYLADAAGVANVVMAPPGIGLGPLTTVASVLVTANSTAAIEAMPLGVPALVVALPGNLSPFVEAGAMAGADSPARVEPALRALLYDRKMRLSLEEAQGAFMRRYHIDADGGAARRAADATLSLART